MDSLSSVSLNNYLSLQYLRTRIKITDLFPFGFNTPMLASTKGELEISVGNSHNTLQLVASERSERGIANFRKSIYFLQQIINFVRKKFNTKIARN